MGQKNKKTKQNKQTNKQTKKPPKCYLSFSSFSSSSQLKNNCTTFCCQNINKMFRGKSIQAAILQNQVKKVVVANSITNPIAKSVNTSSSVKHDASTITPNEITTWRNNTSTGEATNRQTTHQNVLGEAAAPREVERKVDDSTSLPDGWSFDPETKATTKKQGSADAYYKTVSDVTDKRERDSPTKDRVEQPSGGGAPPKRAELTPSSTAPTIPSSFPYEKVAGPTSYAAFSMLLLLFGWIRYDISRTNDGVIRVEKKLDDHVNNCNTRLEANANEEVKALGEVKAEVAVANSSLKSDHERILVLEAQARLNKK